MSAKFITFAAVMGFISRYMPYYRANLRLAFPVILSQAGQITVQLADTAMVGHYGGNDPIPLAAVSFGSSIFYLVFIAIMGISFGLTPLVGEYYAKGDKARCKSLLQNGFVLYGVVGVLATLILMAIRPLIPLLGNLMLDGGDNGSIVDVITLSLPYYDTLVWATFPIMLFYAVKQFLEGIGNTRIAMVVIISCNMLNIVLNWLFIYGKWGFAEMGAVGAGWATFISRMAMCVAICIYFFTTRRFGEYTRDFLSRSLLRIRICVNLLRIGVPIAFQMFMESLAFVAANIVVLAFGATAVSAYQIGTNMMNLTFMIVVAIGSATTILCSHIYGRKEYGELRRTTRAAYQMGLVWVLSVATLYVIFRSAIPELFTTNEQVIDMASAMLVVIALFQMSDCLQALSISILRGLQDVKIIIPIVFLAYVVITTPAGWLFAFEWGMGPVGLIVALTLGLSTVALCTMLRANHTIKQLEKEVEN